MAPVNCQGGIPAPAAPAIPQPSSALAAARAALLGQAPERSDEQVVLGLKSLVPYIEHLFANKKPVPLACPKEELLPILEGWLRRHDTMTVMEAVDTGWRLVLGDSKFINPYWFNKHVGDHLGAKAPMERTTGTRTGSEALEFWDSAFAGFREAVANDSNWEFCRHLTAFGSAVAAEFLHDELGLDANACALRIESEREKFISEARNKERAREYLSLAEKATEQYMDKLDDKCVWHQMTPVATGTRP